MSNSKLVSPLLFGVYLTMITKKESNTFHYPRRSELSNFIFHQTTGNIIKYKDGCILGCSAV
jgi:hypothetical protein